MKCTGVEFTDGRITIRPHRLEDAVESYESVRESLQELMPWMTWCHPDSSFGEIRDWVLQRPGEWESDREYSFGIYDNADGSYIGNCGMDHIDLENNFAELGYWVRTSRTKQGIATAASRLVLDFAFDVLKFGRVELIIACDNHASQRVAEKLGAKKEGLLRNRLKIRERVCDAYLFSVIPSDYYKS